MDAKEIQENQLGREETRDMALHRFRSSNTVTMSPELFEKLYLQPMGSVKGDLRKTFGNPTPLGLIGFAVALTPLACCLMGWRGSGNLGAANMWADLRFKVSDLWVLIVPPVVFSTLSAVHFKSSVEFWNSSWETPFHLRFSRRMVRSGLPYD